MICHNCASPTCGAITKCCFDGAITIERITPVPVTVIVRIYDEYDHRTEMNEHKYQNTRDLIDQEMNHRPAIP